MSSVAFDEETLVQSGHEDNQPLSRTVEWAISVFLVLSGSVFAVGGALLAEFADIGRITSWVEAGRITSTEMSDPELINAVYALIWGGGIGLAATGALLVIAGAAFFGFQTRARRHFEVTGIASPSVVGTAILGAMVTIVGAFVPFSPVLGGAVSGHLGGGAERSAVRSGLLAGLFAALPVAVAYVVITWSLIDSATGLTPTVLTVLAISLVLSLAYMVGLSGLGGYLGARIDRV
jgi:hypothetical protein